MRYKTSQGFLVAGNESYRFEPEHAIIVSKIRLWLDVVDYPLSSGTAVRPSHGGDKKTGMLKLLTSLVVVIDARTPRSCKDMLLAATDIRANQSFSIGLSDLGVQTLITPTN